MRRGERGRKRGGETMGRRNDKGEGAGDHNERPHPFIYRKLPIIRPSFLHTSLRQKWGRGKYSITLEQMSHVPQEVNIHDNYCGF